MADPERSESAEKLLLGHHGAGDDCIGKVIDQTGKFFLAGEERALSPHYYPDIVLVRIN